MPTLRANVVADTIHGEIQGSNTISASTITATTLNANVVADTIHGEIQGSNTISASTITATTLNANVDANNVTADIFYGDGGLLSNIASTFQDVTDNGNTTTQVVQFTNPTTAFTTNLNANVLMNLTQLNDVTITNPVSDQVLVHDGTNWKNDYPIHNYIKVFNNTLSDIPKGKVVYIVDSKNNNVSNVALALSDSSSTMPAIGLAYDVIPSKQEGVVVAYGKVQGVDTYNFVEGEIMFVSNVVSGGISNVKPLALTDSIQNIGICVKAHQTNGVVFVTGVGRSNDIPNAPLSSSPNYVYVNETGNDLKKITPSNLLTKIQTLEQVVNTGNTTSNVIQFTAPDMSLVATGNISVGGLKDPNGVNQYLTMVDTDGELIQAPVHVEKSTGKYIITAAEAEFLGNITLSGNNTVVSSTSVTIQDRIFGIGANNAVHNLDTGIIMEHKDGTEYANVALIYHADEHRFSVGYTQNTFTDDHILHYQDPDHVIKFDILGNAVVQNNLSVITGSYFGDGTKLTGVALSSDLTSNVTRITNLESNLVANASRITNLESNLVANSTRITNLNSNLVANALRITNLESNLVANSTRITNLNSNLVANALRITNLESNLVANSTRITNLNSNLVANALRITNLESNLVANSTRITNLNSNLVANALRITNLESNLIANSTRITNLNSNLVANALRITNLESNLIANSTRITNLNSNLVANALRITNLESNLIANSTRITNLNSNLVANALRITNLESNLIANSTRITNLNSNLVANALRITNLESNLIANSTRITNLNSNLVANALRITNLESNLIANASRITNLNSNLVANALRITNLESNLIANASRITNLNSNLVANALRITNLESNLIANSTRITNLNSNLVANALRITNLESNLVANALRITNLESNLVANASRISNLETSNELVWSSLDLKANLTDPVFPSNVTISGNLTVSGTTTTLNTENLTVKDPIIALSNAAGAVDSGVLINRPAAGDGNVFMGFDHSLNEYQLGYTDNNALEQVITVKDNTNFVANVHGNVHAKYFIGDGSLLTGVVTGSGGGGTLQEITDAGNTTSNTVQFTNTDTSFVASGDIEAKNIQLNDPSITTTFASGMLTIDAANKTYGTGSLITLTQNMTDLSYSNLIEGSQVIIPITSSGGNYTVSNTFSNVDYHVYSDVATISAGNQGLMTVSNLNGNVYMNMLPFQDLPTGSGGGGSSGYVSGDLTVTGGLTITDLDVTASVTGNVITLDGGNRTFGVSPLLDVSSNVEHLVYYESHSRIGD
jgi:uncharacterized coiled-coil protein SlyX